MRTSIIKINPKGRLGNQMFQLMLAQAIANKVSHQANICGFNMPCWNLISSIEDHNISFPTLKLRGHLFNLDKVAYLLNIGALSSVLIEGFGMRLEYYGHHSEYQKLFRPQTKSTLRIKKNQILINVRAEDILDGHHPKYYPMSFSFYEKVIDESGMEPIFIGQLEEGNYNNALRLAFKGAKFLETTSDPMQDFQTMRSAEHIVLSVSTFSWLASWLSETAQTIHLPVAGLFSPANGETMLLPIDDPRYFFYKVPFPEMEIRKTINLVKWASEKANVSRLDNQLIGNLILKHTL